MSDVEDLAGRLFRLTLERDPIEGSQLGFDWCEGLLPDLSSGAERRWTEQVRQMQRELDGIVPRPDDPFTVPLIRADLVALEGDLAAGWSDFTVDATFVGPSVQLLSVLPKAQLDTPERVENYLQRLAQVPVYLGQAVERLRSGTAQGRTATRCGIEATVRQIDAYLSTGRGSDPFVVEPTIAEALATGARARIADQVEAFARPALRDYQEALSTQFRPTARPDDLVGLGRLPGGPELYAAALRRHSSTDLTPDQVHAIGLAAIEALGQEVSRIGAEQLGTSSPRDVFTTVRERRDLRFDDPEEMVRHCRAAMDRAEERLSEVTSLLPDRPCRLEVMNEAESQTGTLGYYQPPGADDGPSGAFWLNTGDAPSRPRYEYEALTFHESVPGHHVEVSGAQQLTELPEFRRFGNIGAYSEGWALYTERLCDEMGLYGSELDRLGMLSFALWRACRLVVDTGIHHLGWGRAQAVTFLHENTGLSRGNVINEVDRYIAWPGQATGYYLGYEWIRRARAEAADRDGAAFDLRAFHDQFLGHGPMPLAVLAQVFDPGRPGG